MKCKYCSIDCNPSYWPFKAFKQSLLKMVFLNEKNRSFSNANTIFVLYLPQWSSLSKWYKCFWCLNSSTELKQNDVRNSSFANNLHNLSTNLHVIVILTVQLNQGSPNFCFVVLLNSFIKHKIYIFEFLNTFTDSWCLFCYNFLTLHWVYSETTKTAAAEILETLHITLITFYVIPVWLSNAQIIILIFILYIFVFEKFPRSATA